MKTPILETERLTLRPLSMDDVPAIEKYFNNWNIVKYTSAPWPLPKNNAAINIVENLELVESGKQLSWSITLKEQAECIGRIDYRFQDDPPDRGFWLAEPYQAQGFMSEAVTATQDYIFFDLQIDKVIVENVEGNIGSRKVKERNGAVFLHKKQGSCSPHIEGQTEVWEITRENRAKVRGKKR